MLRHNHCAVAFIIFACFTLWHCAEENGGIAVVAGSDYDGLIRLFNEFREFQQPAFINSVPDYTSAAMEEQKY